MRVSYTVIRGSAGEKRSIDLRNEGSGSVIRTSGLIGLEMLVMKRCDVLGKATLEIMGSEKKRQPSEGSGSCHTVTILRGIH